MRRAGGVANLFLAVWLVLMGLSQLLGFAIPGVILGLLALVAGLLMLFGNLRV